MFITFDFIHKLEEKNMHEQPRTSQEDTIVTLDEVVEHEDSVFDEAHAVLGDMTSNECSFLKGYVRQVRILS